MTEMLTPEAEAVLQRIIDTNTAERCYVVRDESGNVIDVISAADLDDPPAAQDD